jgi:hypothetical protein
MNLRPSLLAPYQLSCAAADNLELSPITRTNAMLGLPCMQKYTAYTNTTSTKSTDYKHSQNSRYWTIQK